MNAKQIITYNLHGTAVTEEKVLPITLEADEPRHLESGVINIYPEITYQTIEGFGGAMTETSGYLYSTLTEENKKKFLEEHFGPNGQHYKFIRMHIDSCDYSLIEYQAVEDPITDPDFATFTIDRDRLYMLPLLKDAMAMTAEPFSVLLSPWSPPKQWKTPPAKPKNDAIVYGGYKMDPVDYTTPSRNNGGSLKKEYYGAWARYLTKYVLAYLEEGVPVTMMSLQNESIAATNWDSCVWTAAEQKTFLKDHLYPCFKEAGLAGKVGLYIWDHNKERVYEYAREIIDDETKDMLEGIAFHWYSGDHFEAVRIANEMFPSMKLMLSECCALHPPGKLGMFAMMMGCNSVAEADYKDASDYAHDIIGNLNNGMNRWIDWNLCVDKDGGPRHVAMGFGAPVCVDNENGTYRKLLTFDYISHFSKYILPGSKRIGFSRCDDKVDVTAAKTPEGTIVVEVLNRSARDLSYAIRMNGDVIRIDAPAQTVSTILV